MIISTICSSLTLRVLAVSLNNSVSFSNFEEESADAVFSVFLKILVLGIKMVGVHETPNFSEAFARLFLVNKNFPFFLHYPNEVEVRLDGICSTALSF